jgi:hypothetical protein
VPFDILAAVMCVCNCCLTLFLPFVHRKVCLVCKLNCSEASIDPATLSHTCHVMSRSWWKWVQAADANDKAALQQLEDRLSMEEIAHFRAFVAAQSSKLLIKSETHLQHAVDAVDAVVANLGQPLRRHHHSLCFDHSHLQWNSCMAMHAPFRTNISHTCSRSLC